MLRVFFKTISASFFELLRATDKYSNRNGSKKESVLLSVDADRAATNLSVQHYHGSIYPSNPTRKPKKNLGIVSEGVHKSNASKSHSNQSEITLDHRHHRVGATTEQATRR